MMKPPSVAIRQNDLAQIHIAKKALGLSDDEYRDLLSTVCNVRSSAELDLAGRLRFLAHLQACGWARGPTKGTRGGTPWNPAQRRIWALWQQLADAGLISKRERPALEAWLLGQVGVQRVEWLNVHQQQLAIESLKAWLARSKKAAP